MAVEDELGRGFVELVEDGEDGAAGVAEHGVDLVGADQHFVEDLSAGLALVFGLIGAGGGRRCMGLSRTHCVSR